MLPFIEQTARYESFWSGTIVHAHTGSADNPAVASHGFIPTFGCPSDGNAKVASYRNGLHPCSYHPSMGDAMRTFGIGGDHAESAHSTTTVTNRRGFFSGKSLFRNNQKPKNFGAVADGLSNTVAMSEGVVSATENSYDIKGGVVLRTFNDHGDAVFRPNESLAWITNPANGYAGNPKSFAGVSGVAPAETGRGVNFADGRLLRNGFNTVIGPNRASFFFRNLAGASGMYTVTSNHTGGVNVAMGDGAVRFINDTIESGNSSAWIVVTGDATYPTDGRQPTGRSPFGIWGALGSINGGESASL